MPANIEERCNAVEECYEFMLAYAAQGLPSDEGSQSGGQVREFTTGDQLPVDRQPERVDPPPRVAHGPVSRWRDPKDATHTGIGTSV